MARSRTEHPGKGRGQSGWLTSLLGIVLLVAAGFGLGLVVGVVSEEPELVMGHLAGRSEKVVFRPAKEGDPDADLSTPAHREADPEGWDEVVDRMVPETAGRRPERPRDTASFEHTPERAGLPKVGAAPPRARRIDELPSAAAATGRASASGSGPKGWDSASTGGFSVQVGAFATMDAATRVQARLVEHGFQAYLVPPTSQSDGRARVRVGPVPSKSQADALALALKRQERLPTWVLSENRESRGR